jgi:hypothetical protein
MTLIVYSNGFVAEVAAYLRIAQMRNDLQGLSSRLGVTLSDRRWATSLDETDYNQAPVAPIVKPARPTYTRTRHWSTSWWIHGIPPPGALWVHFGWPFDDELIFGCECPAMGLELTFASLPARSIRTAGLRSGARG